MVYLSQKVKGIDAQPYSMGIIIIGGNNYEYSIEENKKELRFLQERI